jgi:hypothetical protein
MNNRTHFHFLSANSRKHNKRERGLDSLPKNLTNPAHADSRNPFDLFFLFYQA